jgi:hypothetical protein
MHALPQDEQYGSTHVLESPGFLQVLPDRAKTWRLGDLASHEYGAVPLFRAEKDEAIGTVLKHSRHS